jgi:hypothetical protein
MTFEDEKWGGKPEFWSDEPARTATVTQFPARLVTGLTTKMQRGCREVKLVHRCCVCGIQLDLLDAAHIIPVEHERGTDEIKNGLSLCALHHRAFDHALITVCTDYSISCSEKEFKRLRTIGWHGGESEFKAALRDEISLPPKREIYPAIEYLEFGQKIRGWIN